LKTRLHPLLHNLLMVIGLCEVDCNLDCLQQKFIQQNNLFNRK